jgi:hypothetical protein
MEKTAKLVDPDVVTLVQPWVHPAPVPKVLRMADQDCWLATAGGQLQLTCGNNLLAI